MDPNELIPLITGGSALAIIAIVVIGSLVSIAFTIFMIVVIRKWVKKAFLPDQNLLANGTAAQALIVKIWDTGVTLNDHPQVGMLLEVHPANESPFRVETKSIVNRLMLAQVQPGATVPVKFDPTDRSKVALAWS